MFHQTDSVLDVEKEYSLRAVTRLSKRKRYLLPVVRYVTTASVNERKYMTINDVISNVEVYGLNPSIRGAKFPMSVDTSKLTEDITPGIMKLAQAERGSGHDNWLKGVIVQFDLTLTVKAWTEAERYHWLDFVSSQSTMHKITKFDLDTAYIKYVDPRIIAIVKEKVDEYNRLCQAVVPQSTDAIAEHERVKAEKYLEVLYNNPVGFRLSARMSTNYLQLKTIYGQRRNHRLPEWRIFCQWIESLPMSELITGGNT